MFFSKILNSTKIKKLESEASDIFELPEDLKAIRVNGEIVIVNSNNKISERFKDVFPSNPARATYQIMKKLDMTSSYDNYKKAFEKKEQNIWTCGFRESEERWVWYKNSLPQMTASFKEVFSKFDSEIEECEKRIDFCSAKFGTSIVDRIKQEGIKSVAASINALVLENPYSLIKCSGCKTVENYTIDDLVDENKKAKYDSNFVVCTNCNTLIKLL